MICIQRIKQHETDLDFQRGFEGFKERFWLCIKLIYERTHARRTHTRTHTHTHTALKNTL